MLFVDASTNRVGIGSSSPNKNLEILAANATLRLEDTTSGSKRLEIGVLDTAVAFIDAPQSAQTLKMSVSSTESFTQYHNTTGAVFNEGGADRNFRVESDTNANMLFVDAGEDRVGIGATGGSQTGSKFYVEGRTALSNGSVTGGSVLITDAYTPSTNDHILNIGTQRSSGGPFIAYGLGHAQNSDGFWKSTYDNFDGSHSVLVLNGSTLEYYLDASNSQTTVGDTVAVKNGYKVGRLGTVFNDDGYSDFDFRVESATNTHALFVDVSAGTVAINTATLTHAGSTAGSLVVNGGSTSATTPVMMVVDGDGSVEGRSTLLECNFSADNGFSVANYVQFRDLGGVQGTIDGTGDGTVAYRTSSDERLKQKIQDTESKWDLVKSLQVRDYEWKKSGKQDTGFIAQELHDKWAQPVKVGGEDVINDPWSVDYGKLTPILTKALQEAMEKIETLEARIAALES